VAVVRMLLHAELRQRWKSWLWLALLVALVSGLVLAGVAAGRRTSSAFPRFVLAHGYDAIAYSFEPLPKIAALPEVASVTAVQSPGSGTPRCACTHKISENGFSLYEVPKRGLSRLVKLVAGEMPSPSDPDQVLASFTWENDGVHVGSVIRLPTYARSQQSALVNGENVASQGPTIALHVVGIEAAESEFPGGSSVTEYDLYATQALARLLAGKTANYWGYFVRLTHGASDIPRFEADVQALGADGSSDQDTPAATVVASIHPQAVGWWILAGLTALVGIIVLGQAFSRQAAVASRTRGILSALGITQRQMVLVGMGRTLLVGALGVTGGILLAFLLSPLTPVGEARLAETSNGFTFDAFVLLLGAVAAMVLVLALGFVPALRSARTGPAEESHVARPSRIVGFLAGAGGPPSMLIGVRRALERGHGRDAVPVGSALLGSILAVAALCATTVFGASLSHLTATPSLYGQPFDAWLGTNGLPSTPNTMLSGLLHTRAVTGITGGISGDVRINGKTVDALAGDPLRGPLLLTTVNGELPSSATEITLGATTIREVGAHVGALVKVTAPVPGGGARTSTYRVVGTTSFPPDFGAGGLGTGAVFTFGGYFRAQCAPGTVETSCEKEASDSIGGVYLLRVQSGASGRAALSGLARQYPSSFSYPTTPANLVNFGEAVNFPFILGLVLIVFGVASLVHVLFVSVARRRREAGLLKALGLVRRQIAFSVWWQTTTVALVGIVVGVPVGIIVGRAIWQAFARNLGVLPESVVLGSVIVAVAVGALVVANLLAIGPAMVASRSRPASLLRSE
jgi:ABC-type lipoprotein release transport system permease subunit